MKGWMIFFPHQTWLYICHVEKKLYHFWLLYYVHMMRNLSETLHYTIIMLIKKCIHYFTTLSLKKHFFRCMSVFFLIRLYAALAFLPMLNGKINNRRKDFFFLKILQFQLDSNRLEFERFYYEANVVAIWPRRQIFSSM